MPLSVYIPLPLNPSSNLTTSLLQSSRSWSYNLFVNVNLTKHIEQEKNPRKYFSPQRNLHDKENNSGFTSYILFSLAVLFAWIIIYKLIDLHENKIYSVLRNWWPLSKLCSVNLKPLFCFVLFWIFFPWGVEMVLNIPKEYDIFPKMMLGSDILESLGWETRGETFTV